MVWRTTRQCAFDSRDVEAVPREAFLEDLPVVFRDDATPFAETLRTDRIAGGSVIRLMERPAAVQRAGARDGVRQESLVRRREYSPAAARNSAAPISGRLMSPLRTYLMTTATNASALAMKKSVVCVFGFMILCLAAGPGSPIDYPRLADASRPESAAHV
jgi:hypothetical protein